MNTLPVNPSDRSRTGNGRRILLVDDDAQVRKTLRALLLDAGYTVEDAADGMEAVAAIDRACPDLLLSDLVMPPPTGQELAQRCLERCPDTVVVFMSGYSEDELHDLDIKQVVFIPKPIEADRLRSTVRNLLR